MIKLNDLNIITAALTLAINKCSSLGLEVTEYRRVDKLIMDLQKELIDLRDNKNQGFVSIPVDISNHGVVLP